MQYPRDGVLEKPFQAITPRCTAGGFLLCFLFIHFFSAYHFYGHFVFYFFFSYLLFNVRGCVLETFVLPPSPLAYTLSTRNRVLFLQCLRPRGVCTVNFASFFFFFFFYCFFVFYSVLLHTVRLDPCISYPSAPRKFHHFFGHGSVHFMVPPVVEKTLP